MSRSNPPSLFGSLTSSYAGTIARRQAGVNAGSHSSSGTGSEASSLQGRQLEGAALVYQRALDYEQHLKHVKTSKFIEN